MQIDGERPKINYKETIDFDQKTGANSAMINKTYEPHMGEVNRILDVDLAHDMANDTQKGYLNAERRERETGIKDNVELLVNKLVEGLSRSANIEKFKQKLSNEELTEFERVKKKQSDSQKESGKTPPGQDLEKIKQNLTDTLERRLSNIKILFENEKIINKGSDLTILEKILNNHPKDSYPQNVITLDKLFVNKDTYDDYTMYCPEFMEVMGFFPEDGQATIKNIKEINIVESKKLVPSFRYLFIGKVEKKTLKKITVNIREFTNPTVVDGVNLTVGFKTNAPEGMRWRRNICNERIELTPQFISKAIGISTETK